MFIDTFAFNYYYILISQMFLGAAYTFTLLMSLNILSESVSNKYRALATSIVNVGDSCSAIFFTPLYGAFNSWKKVQINFNLT